MALHLPAVRDPLTQRALNRVAKAFPVTGAYIRHATIENVHIVENTLTGSLFVEGTITGKIIAGETIEGSNIKAGTITATQIAANTITAEQIAAHTITAEQIKAGSITTGSLEAESITTELLRAEAVTAAKIKANTIEAGQIKAGTITATEIKAETITANKLVSHTITATQIAAETITSTEIASASIIGGDIASGTITAGNITISKLSALSADLGTITAGTVTGATLRTAAEGTRWEVNTEAMRAFSGATAVLDFNLTTGNLKIKGTLEEGSTIPAATITGQLTNAQLKEIEAAKITGTITETQIGNESVTTGKIKANAVTAAKIAAETITAEQIASATITATQIKASTITGAKIASETIEAGNIKASTITASQIASETITGTKIAASTITAAKLSVTELSAIAANLGTITAGTVTGATVQSSTANPKVGFDSTGIWSKNSTGTKTVQLRDSKGLSILGGTTSTPSEDRKVEWLNASGESQAEIFSYAISPQTYLLARNVLPTGYSEGYVQVKAAGEKSSAFLEFVTAGTEEGTATYLKATAGSKTATILNAAGSSSFLRLTTTAERKLNRGTAKVEWAVEGTNSAELTVEHELGATPQSIVCTVRGVAGTGFFVPRITERTSTSFKVQIYNAEKEKIAAKQTREVDWIATT